MSKNEVFRADIQGLRGLAIVLVVLEHTTSYFQGGYVGVDVFFVISGYLITLILLRQIQETGAFSLNDFYSRRARRLLPALTVVLITTLFISIFILSPGLEQDKTVMAAFSSFFFIANLYYMLQGGYFFLESDPLRHLWSLGVEEQFYLIYPVLILLMLRFSKLIKVSFRKLFMGVLFVLAVSSFFFSALLSLGLTILPLQSRLSFFGTPFRLWELIAGGILAGIQLHKWSQIGRYWRRFIQIVGLLLIIWASVTYNQFTIFPGFAAFPPVFGAALIIFSGLDGSQSRSVLTIRPLTFLGDISYGLYLWHWPLVVFAKRMYPNSHLAVVGAVLVALIVSTFQLKFLENPMRERTEIFGKLAIRFWFKSLSGVFVFGAILFGLSWTGLGVDRSSQFESLPRFADNCSFTIDSPIIPPGCGSYENAGPHVLLIGDSQAGALSDGFVAAAKELNFSFEMVYSNSCPIHARPNELRAACATFLSSLPTLIESTKPDLIVIANASDLYVSRGGYGKPDTQIRMVDGSFPSNYKESLDNWTAGLKEIFEYPVFSQRQLIYVQMIPAAPVHGPSIFNGSNSSTSFALSVGFDRNLITLKERDVLLGLSNIELLDPADILCPNDNCLLDVGDGPIYSDQFHLNTRGSQLLTEKLTSLIRSSLLP